MVSLFMCTHNTTCKCTINVLNMTVIIVKVLFRRLRVVVGGWGGGWGGVLGA
jgi:hypothetical protein